MMRVQGFDPHTPSIARIYDYLLGGKDHLAVDRAIGEQLVAIYPEARKIVAENRQFLARVVAWAARQGIRQFIDLGCGMPTEPSTHEIAQAACPGARVAYVDTDPVALAHLRAFAEHGNDAVTVTSGDARDVGAVLKAVSASIDVSEPACLLIGCVLHYFPAVEAREVAAGYAAALAPGSYLVLSVGRGDGPLAKAYISTYSDHAAQVYNYRTEEFARFFGSLPLVAPGVVDASQWRPDPAQTPETPAVRARQGQIIVGVARLP
jgi:O-methyltransferase involved in polyketide biosynthesis